jgi:twitching motility protein PilT
MKALEQLLRELARPEVSEFAVVTERLPCVKVGDKYDPVDDNARPTEEILDMLNSIGGIRHIEHLESRPAQWTTRVEGVGLVAVQAVMRGGRVQARFTLAQPEVAGSRGAAAPPRAEPPPQRPPERAPVVAERVHVADPAPTVQERAPSVADRAPIVQQRAPAVADRAVAAPTERAFEKPRGTGKVPGWLDKLLSVARGAAASDVHVVADRAALVRVGGDLQSRDEPIDAAAVEAAVVEVVPPRLWPTLQEQGSCDFAFDRPGVGRFRVNVSRQRSGYKACFRCIGSEVPTLALLGLPPEIERATHHHQGLVLVTGPTGHGKTSTLSAIVDIINSNTTHHVITVEDPVEYIHPRKKAMISQREVGSTTRSFASALKASLREDPDVIVVGELRDTETVRMALAASETGHLVIGTMNTPSAAKTIDRMIDLFPPADQPQVRMTLAGGLHLIVGQRLVPAADGRGMVAAVELLTGSIALWNLIRDAKTYQIPSLQQRGKGVGIVRLDESLGDLVRAGRISRDHAFAVAENPDDLDEAIAGKAAAAPALNPNAPKQKPQDGSPGLLGRAGNLFGKRGA